MGRTLARIIALTFILLLLGCREAEPEPTATPEPVSDSIDTAASPSEPTEAPSATASPTQPPATNTPESAAMMPTATPTTAAEEAMPTATPLATTLVEVEVRNAETAEPVAGASVRLVNEAVAYDATVVTGATTGAASFAGLEATTTSVYTLSVSAPGFRSETMEIVVERGRTEIEVDLTPGVSATTTIISNLRSGPGLTYEILAEVPEGETVSVMARSEDEQWAQVQRTNGEEGWIFADLLDFEGDLGGVGEADAPPAPSATPITPTATTVPGATPTVTVTVQPTVEAGEIPPRPGAVAFEPVALRDSMVTLQGQLENMGFLLDLIENGDSPNCEAFVQFFTLVATSPQYSGAPDEWQDLNQLYEDTIANVVRETADVFFICQGGDEGVDISPFNRRRARTAIEEGIGDMINGIRVANEMLEG